MTSILRHMAVGRIPGALTMLMIVALSATACGGGAPASAPAATASGVAVAAASATVPPAPVNQGAPAPKASIVPVKNTQSSVDCAAADEAYQHFAFNTQLIFQLRDDRTYEALLDPTSMFYLDTKALRADLTVLSTLPDITGGQGDKPSAIISSVRQVLDLIDSNAKSGKPFSDGSGNGQKVLDLWTPLFMTQRASSAFADAFQAGCAQYTPAPRPTATPKSFAAKTKAECAALNTAMDDFGPQSFFLAALTDDAAYAMFQPGGDIHVDTTALHADLAVLATLPDIAEVEAQYHGKPSQMVPLFQQLLTQADANVKAGSKPFSDGSGNGQKVVDLAQAAMGEGRSQVFPATVSLVCQ
jgi:hypothetical protein